MYAFTSCACLVGLQISRIWDCWVSSLSTPIGLLIETTQLIFHTLKGKGKKIKRVVCKTWLCWNIIHSSSGVSRHQIYSLTRHSFHGCWHSQACGVKNHRKSLQKKPGWTESFDCVLMFFGTDIVLSTQWCSQGMQEKCLNLKLQTHLQEFLLVVTNKVSGQFVFEVLTSEQNNQKEDEILVPVSVDNHEESTNISFIFFIFNH